jgi:hypothetical protein
MQPPSARSAIMTNIARMVPPGIGLPLLHTNRG